LDASAATIVDLFCGVGGLSLGALEALASVGVRAEFRWAVDFDETAAACYARNFPKANFQHADLTTVFADDLYADIGASEAELALSVGHVDLLLGGPPCQGHSDLNNYSRRADPKNRLYTVMARAAIVLRPQHVIIENVPGAKHDRFGSMAATVEELRRLGYHVDADVVEALPLGVPQSRKRLIVVGSLKRPYQVSVIAKRYERPQRDLAWAIEDLARSSSTSIYSSPAISAPVTRQRINYLFDNDLFDLPDSERPRCHRDKKHSYKSVYGRLRWNAPAQTITSGFYSMCMGRYVHPSMRRTLTAHEAARIQFFPDYFDFSPVTARTSLAQLIGNAVPPKMIYPFVRELFA
jgi:DNA (cytosine-5)-methyltransferase 1